MGRITEILDEGSVPYMLTGSLAAAYYATPRATQDIDVVIEASLEQLSNLVQKLTEAGLYVSVEAAHEASRLEGQFNAIDPETGWKADFIIRKDRPFSASEFERRRTASVLGLDLSLASAEDLIIAKLEWAKKGGSELQLRDVQAILRSQLDHLDQSYIEHWAEELELAELWKRVQQDVSS